MKVGVYGLQVFDGGVVRAVGSVAEPVVFTSAADDAAGGDTDGDGDQPPSDTSRLIRMHDGSSVSIAHARMRYADIAVAAVDFHSCVPASPEHAAALSIVDSDLAAGIEICGVVDDALLDGVTIHDAPLALSVNSAAVSFRGGFHDVERAIIACRWQDSTCSVDAAHVEWGTPGGPWSDTGEDLVCGHVVADPYRSGGAVLGSPRVARNCDGSPTHWDQATAAQAAFADRVNAAGIDCALLGDDVCAAIDSAFQCLSAAVDLAAAQSPFPLPAVDGTPAGWEGYAEPVGEAGATYLRTSADAVVADVGHVASRAFDILGVVNLALGLADAYDRCAP